MNKGKIIDDIISGSIAEELGLAPGDILISINDNLIEDVLDYRFYCKEEFLSLLIRRGDEEAVFEVEKDSDEELGLVFNDGLMDDYHSCCNKCIFCFIDQMPPNMRKTLYFKDDDERLSFLQGNYITLTNLKEHDIQRIIDYRLSPINISIQTMNKELRCKMLGNKFAGDKLEIMDRFYDAGISMNAQIVLCEGINDGDELEYTIEQLSKYLPYMESVSVVPVGLTRFRDNLTSLKPISIQNANRTIDIVEKWQRLLYPKFNLHFIHASDEFYLMTGRELPDADSYDGYLQYENGVGMIRHLIDSFDYEISNPDLMGDDNNRTVSIATSVLAKDSILYIANEIKKKFANTQINVYTINNDFFGNSITVAGLITGKDLKNQLLGKELGDRLLISQNMLRFGENVFLDDISVKEVESALGTKVYSVENDGYALIHDIIDDEVSPSGPYNSYEM